MVPKSGKNHLERTKPVVFNGINYQPLEASAKPNYQRNQGYHPVSQHLSCLSAFFVLLGRLFRSLKGSFGHRASGESLPYRKTPGNLPASLGDIATWFFWSFFLFRARVWCRKRRMVTTQCWLSRCFNHSVTNCPRAWEYILEIPVSKTPLLRHAWWVWSQVWSKYT